MRSLLLWRTLISGWMVGFAHVSLTWQKRKKEGESSYVFLDGVSSKLSGENIEDLLSNPTTFGERRERKVVRVDFAQTCKENKTRKFM